MTMRTSVLGRNFITPGEVSINNGLVYSIDQIHYLMETKPSDDTLRWCGENNYSIVPAPPTNMSILEIGNLAGKFCFLKNTEFARFANEDKTSFGWLAIKNTPAFGSENEDWERQQKFISDLERVPNSAEVAWFTSVLFSVRNIRTFEGVPVKTSSYREGGSYIFIFRVGTRVCIDNDIWFDRVHIGLAAALKL